MALEMRPNGYPGRVPPDALQTQSSALPQLWRSLSEALTPRSRSEPARRAARWLSYGLLAGLVGVLLLVATAAVPVLFGYHTYIVDGGSMEPSLRTGSVAVTHPTSPRALEVGDVIAWRASPKTKPVLHRIIEIKDTGGKRLFITQGDQNRTPDATPVELAGEGDRVVYSVPYAGYVLKFAQSGAGRVLLVGMPLILLAAFLLKERGRLAQVKELKRSLEVELPPPAAARPQPPAQPGPAVAPVPRPAMVAAATMGPRRAVQPRPAPVALALATDAADLPAFLMRQLRRPPASAPEPFPFRPPAADGMPHFGAGRRERPAA